MCAGDVDGVVVATPNDWLAPITCTALEAGKHVLCEKPPGRDVAEAKTMRDSAARSGRLFAFGFNHRHAAGVHEALDIARTGGIGRLLHAQARYGHGGRPGLEHEWRADPKRAGGGEMMDQGAHLLDLARLILGEVERVYAITRTEFWPLAPLEDNAFCLLEHVGGAVSMRTPASSSGRTCSPSRSLATRARSSPKASAAAMAASTRCGSVGGYDTACEPNIGSSSS
mgnify:CR=1 FL=1